MPATAKREKCLVRKGVEEIGKGASETAKQEKAHSATIVREDQRRLEEMLNAERIKRLEKMISKLKPEEQEKIQAFFDRLMKWIQQYRQAGAHSKWLEEHAEAYLEGFCEEIWHDSRFNKKRIEIMMRFLKANEVLPA